MAVSPFWKADPKSRGNREDPELQKQQVANGNMWSFSPDVDVVGMGKGRDGSTKTVFTRSRQCIQL